MAEARSPGLPRYRTFRPQPGLARRLVEHGELLAAVRPQASALQVPAAVEVSFLVIRRPLPREALASLPVSVCALACRAALISAKHRARASRAVSDLALAVLPRWILLYISRSDSAI